MFSIIIRVHGLFLDFAKAYDSVSRRYLLTLMCRIGVPHSYCCLVDGLFTETEAKPIMRSGHGVRIYMEDGLKQGCPLSPLFVLAMDPLMTRLAEVTMVEEKAFADLAWCFHQLEDLARLCT